MALLGTPYADGVLLSDDWALTACATDWQPTRALRSDEADRIHAARMFVETRRSDTGRLPATYEFQKWARSAPDTLRLDGVGFTYDTARPPVYDLSWWGSNARLGWRSDTASLHLAEISSSDFFFFGSKLLDLLIFTVLDTGAIFAARLISVKNTDANWN